MTRKIVLPAATLYSSRYGFDPSSAPTSLEFRILIGRLAMVLMCLTLSSAMAFAQTYAYVTNFNSASVSVVDTGSNAVTATVPVGVNPYGVAITPNATRLYVANQNTGNVSVIDTATNTVAATVTVGSLPTGIAITPDGARVYVTNFVSSTVSVIDTANNSVISTVQVGNSPTAVQIMPDGSRAYVVNSFGSSVSVIDTSSNTVTSTIPISGRPYWLALTPDGAHAWVSNQSLGSVSVIDTATDTVETTIPVGSDPYGIAVTPDGSHAYVTNLSSGSISVINTTTKALDATLTGFAYPYGIAFLPDGTRAYVTSRFGANIWVIDTAANTVTSTVAVGSSPVRVAITPPPPSTDTIPPVLTLPGPTTTVANSAAGAVVTYSATAIDNVDGSVPVQCTPASGSAFPMGATTVSCSASDSKGNKSTGSFTVKVLYSAGMCMGEAGHLALQPINPDGSSIFKLGSTVSAKFRVCDRNGNSVGVAGVVQSFRLVQTISGTTTNSVDEAVNSTTPDSAFRWDPTAQQWIFNMSTKSLSSGSTYVYRIALNDGTAIQFQFGVLR